MRFDVNIDKLREGLEKASAAVKSLHFEERIMESLEPIQGCMDCGTKTAPHFYKQVGANLSMGLVCGECRDKMLRGESMEEKNRKTLEAIRVAPIMRKLAKEQKHIDKVKGRERLDSIRWQRNIREKKAIGEAAQQTTV